MDCVSVYRENGRIDAVEFRNLKKGDLVVLGRTEDASEGIFVHADGFHQESSLCETFSFRQGRSRETAYSKDYDELYELLRSEREHGNILWVMGPACSFDADSRSSFASLIRLGYVQGLMAGNALATHDLEASYLKTALGQNIYTQNRTLTAIITILTPSIKFAPAAQLRPFSNKDTPQMAFSLSASKTTFPTCWPVPFGMTALCLKCMQMHTPLKMRCEI